MRLRTAFAAIRARLDLDVLVLLLTIVASAWAFVTIAGLVDRGATQEIDDSIVALFRDPRDPRAMIGGEVAAELARDLTALGSITVLLLVSLAVAGFLVLEKLFRSLALVLAATLGGTAWTFLLKEAFARPRPQLVAGALTATTSFPSGHSSLSAVVYLTLAVLVARLLSRRTLRAYVIGVAAMTTFAVGLSRVALGVHYPSDVLAGWTLGLAWALACWTATGALQRRGRVETATQAHVVAAELAARDPAPAE